MLKRFRALLLVGFVAAWGFGMSAAALAQDVPGPGGEGSADECVEDVMDLPALNVCKDAQGRHILELPAIGTLREPAPAPTARPKVVDRGGRKLPRTGMHTEDFAAVGLAALAGGAVLMRRLKLAVA